MKKYIAILKKSLLFKGMSEQDLLSMLNCLSATVKDYHKDECVWLSGDQVKQVGLVLGGEVLIIKDDLYGNRSVLSNVCEGDLFGEAFSCAGIKSLPVSVITVSRSTIMLIDYQRIINTCSNTCVFHMKLIKNMLKILADKNIMLTQKINNMSQRTTREKLLSYLADASTRANSRVFKIPFNRQELADYLCVDRSAMSSELGKLKAEGIIDFARSEFKFLKLYNME